MATIFVRHRVNDFAAWKQVYDGFQPTARSLGVTTGTVYQTDGDPTEVTVVHEFATQTAAHAFAGSHELRDAMGRAGVAGAPDIWFADRT